MKSLFRSIVLIATATLAGVAPGLSHEIKAGDLLITNMWTRATPNGAKVAGGYFTVKNSGATPDRLVSATSSAAGKVEVHEMSMANGVMAMRPLEAGLTIDPGKAVTLAPGGYHMMLMDLKEPLKEGALLPIDLQFEKAGKVQVTLHIKGIGATGPGDGAEKSGAKAHDHKM